MKNTGFFIGLLLLGVIRASAQSVASTDADLIIATGDDKVLMMRVSRSADPKVDTVWKWRVSETGGLPAEYIPLLATLDDCKPLFGGDQLLLTSSSGATLLLERVTKKALFYAKTPMAHSAAYLPGDRLVVALSTHKDGNCIQVFDKAVPEKVLWQDSLYSGHGTVWNPADQRLYVLGFGLLKAYSLKNWDSHGKPALQLERSWKLPSEGGHDLLAVSGDFLMVTTHEHVWEFHIKEERWQLFKPLTGMKNVKSVNYRGDTGRLIYTKAEESWWTHHVYAQKPGWTIDVPQIKLYKVRVCDSDE